MNKQFKAKLLEALRSGKYKQGRNVLYDKRDNTFCCLGVAYHCVTGKRPRKQEVLGDIMATRLGLDRWHINANEVNCNQIKLAKMNDCGDSFNNIADWIEKNL